jgi:predicted dehydrogenase
MSDKATDKLTEDDYSLSKKTPDATIDAPDLPYGPPRPKKYQPRIGLIACGGITEFHLKAYQHCGYEVVAFCDPDIARAEKRRDQFNPKGMVTTDYNDVLAREDIDVVDIATHPKERVAIIEAALTAKKHVLSQKPFALSLETAEHLVKLADDNGVKLAVNQNGRWAPHFSYIRNAVQAGVIGDVVSAHFRVHWDHTWTVGTPFENIHDLIFYDFAIHWFDACCTFLGDRKQLRVQAARSRAIDQTAKPPMLAQAILEFEGGQASFAFDAHLRHGALDETYVGGTKGSLFSTGPSLGEQKVTLHTADGLAEPKLEGTWFLEGFAGTMGELLLAIEEDREPSNSARSNLKSLALAYAVIASANDGAAKVPGEVRKLPAGSAPGVD